MKPDKGEKLSLVAGSFLQTLLEENRVIKQRLAELESKVYAMQSDILNTAIQSEIMASALIRTIKYARSGKQTDFEDIAWILRSAMPSPEERKVFSHTEGMEFWIELAEEAESAFPDDPYFKPAE